MLSPTTLALALLTITGANCARTVTEPPDWPLTTTLPVFSYSRVNFTLSSVATRASGVDIQAKATTTTTSQSSSGDCGTPWPDTTTLSFYSWSGSLLPVSSIVTKASGVIGPSACTTSDAQGPTTTTKTSSTSTTSHTHRSRTLTTAPSPSTTSFSPLPWPETTTLPFFSWSGSVVPVSSVATRNTGVTGFETKPTSASKIRQLKHHTPRPSGESRPKRRSA